MRVANLLGRRRLQKFKKPIAKKTIKLLELAEEDREFIPS